MTSMSLFLNLAPSQTGEGDDWIWLFLLSRLQASAGRIIHIQIPSARGRFDDGHGHVHVGLMRQMHAIPFTPDGLLAACQPVP
jgi:hypothetical protein